jgi:hypothetical protein
MNKYDWGLVNQKYTTKHETLVSLKEHLADDLEFYRKRIYQATKELSRGVFKDDGDTITNAFYHYAELLINHFKLDDTKEILASTLETINEDDEDEDVIHDITETEEIITKQLLIGGEKNTVIRIEDCLNIVKKEDPEITTAINKRRQHNKQNDNMSAINLRQEKFREKGVKKKQQPNLA